MNHITVSYATSNDYQYTLVSLTSLILSAYEDVFFDIYLLVDHSFSSKSKREVERYCKQYESKCKISFCCVGHVFDNVCLRTDFINRPTFFRLLVSEIVNAERCIYLDSDTIICTDLYELYNIEMKDKLIAGVKAPGYHLGENIDQYCKQALLPSIDQYVNAGVLLMNLSAMKREHIAEKFLKLLPNNMESQDQDIINSTCYDRILHLPFKYNVMVALTKFSIDDYTTLFPNENLYDSWNNPKIIHYATKIKPWKTLECVMGDYWWDVCKKSCMWDYFYKDLEDEFFTHAVYQTEKNTDGMTTKGVFDYFNLLHKKKIILYGAGNRALELIAYLERYKIVPEYIIVSDKNNNPDNLNGIKVIELDDTVKNNSEKVIIIATLEKYHSEIILQLQKYKFREIIPLSDNWKWADTYEEVNG